MKNAFAVRCAADGPKRAFFKLSGNLHIYLTLTSSGIKAEGKPFSRYFTSPHAARVSWAREFKKYLKEKVRDETDGWFLFWRRKPELHNCGDMFAVSSRLVVLPENR